MMREDDAAQHQPRLSSMVDAEIGVPRPRGQGTMTGSQLVVERRPVFTVTAPRRVSSVVDHWSKRSGLQTPSQSEPLPLPKTS